MHTDLRLSVPVILLFGVVSSFYVAGCNRSTALNQTPATPSQPAQTASPSPKSITTAELTKLRWIEGSWRGTGVDQPPFYERYKFENDSILLVETLADETLSKVTETSRFELKDGHFGQGQGDSSSVATALDDHSISFAPVGKGNYFRFQRESENSWKAILNWIGKDGTAKERVYVMERWPSPKP